MALEVEAIGSARRANPLAWLRRTPRSFRIGAAILLPIQFVLGIKGYKKLHVPLGLLFLVLWVGTFITGVIYLPHE